MSKQNWKALPVNAILKNVELVFKTRNCEKLSKTAYNALYLMSGFIAHYNLDGFRSHYSLVVNLAHDILESSDARDPERYTRDAWFPNEYGMEYCASKTELYRGLRELAEKHLPELEKYHTNKEREDEIALGTFLLQKHGVL